MVLMIYLLLKFVKDCPSTSTGQLSCTSFSVLRLRIRDSAVMLNRAESTGDTSFPLHKPRVRQSTGLKILCRPTKNRRFESGLQHVSSLDW